MADKQISDLTAASALDGTELVHVVQGGNSRKATVDDIYSVWISGEYTLGDITSTTLSTSAFATKGQIIEALYTCKVRAVAAYVGSTSATYKAVVAKLNTSNVITDILATSAAVASPVSVAKPVVFSFSTPAPVTAGDRIAIMIVRTDGATTDICSISFVSSAWTTLARFTAAWTYIGSVRYASVDPAVSDSVLFDTTSHMPCNLLC